MKTLTAVPWTLIRHEDGHHLIVGPDHEEIAEVLGSEVDALVLTAAPDLYGALKILRGQVAAAEQNAEGEEKRVYGQYLRIADEALAKASGAAETRSRTVLRLMASAPGSLGTPESAALFGRLMSDAGIRFHPDDDPRDLVWSDGTPVFDEAQAAKIERLFETMTTESYGAMAKAVTT